MFDTVNHPHPTPPTEPDSVRIEDAIAYATAHGWSDDSRWTPRKIHAQISHLAHGLLSSVRITVNGDIDWRVTRHEDNAPTLPSQRHGHAPTLTDAIAACERTVAAANATLF